MKQPDLYLSRYTGSDGHLRWTVIFKALPVMAETKDRRLAMQWLKRTEVTTNILADQMYDGDQGEFVEMEMG